MSRHDHQGTNNETSSAQFSGDDIEFAPFMFEANPGVAEPPSGTFSDDEMEFEPFMFNAGDGTGMAAPASPTGPAASAGSNASEAATAASPVAPIAPVTPMSPISSIAPVAPMEPEESPAAQMPVDDALPFTFEPNPSESTSMAPDAAASFAGYQVPVPTYLQPLDSVQASPSPAPQPSPVSPVPAMPAAVEHAMDTPLAPMPSATENTVPSIAPLAQSSPRDTSPIATSQPAHQTSPMQEGASADAVSTAAPPTFSGMAGRSRGNTGPLGMALPNASWSDSSLASIEDFSSVLIAMHAGKRVRQSGATSGSASAPSSPTSVGTMAPPQTGVPEWAAQAVTGQESTPEGTAPPTWSPQWAESAEATSAWGTQAHTASTMPDAQPLPPWSMNPPTQPPDATSWTGAQPDMVAPVAPVAPALPAQPTTQAESHSSVLANKAMSELAAIRDAGSEAEASGLEPGVADLLKNMGSSLGEGAVKGDDIQFEGFMFDEGTPAPLPVLAPTDAAAAPPLPQDMGPVFDPAQFANPVETEETHEYGDADDLTRTPSPASGAAGAQGPLPFWLQEQPQVGATSGDGDAAMQAALSGLPQGMGTPTPSTQMSAQRSADDDLGDLPPIDPFDFALLGGGLDDEAFGFNSEELSGLMSGGRDPMIVTANLEALADLMGGQPIILPDARSGRQAGHSHVEMAPPPPAQGEPADVTPAAPQALNALEALDALEAPAGAQPVEPYPTQPDSSEQDRPDAAGHDSKPGGWMATVTTGLTMDTISSLTGNLEGSASNAEMVVEDVDVAPFDYAQLDLDVEEESPTSNLMSGGLQGPRTEQLGAMIERMAEAKTAPRSLGEVWSEADGDTSLFMTLPTPTPPQPVEIEMPTETLSQEARSQAEQANAAQTTGAINAGSQGDGVPEVATQGPPVTAHTPPAAQPSNVAQAPDVVDESAPSPAPEGQPAPADHGVFKARVARGAWAEQAPSASPEPEQAQSSAPVQAQQATSSPVAEQVPAPSQETKPEPTGKDAQAGYGVGVRKAARTKVLEPVEHDAHRATRGMAAQPVVQPHPEDMTTPKMPVQGDIMTSGPLPTLDGFEDLSAWIERYPHDMGAHMALASAYTQSGDIDTALRVYRRMLRKPNVSENVLGMIQEELTDLEAQAQQYPRYFQVRGDLLVRQGHRREAIDEYNKLG